MKDWQKRMISPSERPFGSKSEPPLPPPIGRPVNAFLNGSDQDQAVVVGHSAGAVDVLAGLICLTGGRTCSCLSNVVTQQTERFAEIYAEQLLECGIGEPAFGPAMRAARQVCG